MHYYECICFILSFYTSYVSLCNDYYDCNKAKGRISKRMFQENKARQIFRKTNVSYPLIGDCNDLMKTLLKLNLYGFIFKRGT